ncbi:sensor histidine kinase [Ichthyenterobacterium magnum]|uniref:histidine kinase n=1 Tax=Ichthyenterobacterium magnum TaxID=1230530 RepID=A0A420DGR6_9FLAO|nr:ATP-binding protein [Ichthyenterobacterium magnum]RKE92270.1 histidine kinase [Ichthyenterobacterium magnum]
MSTKEEIQEQLQKAVSDEPNNINKILKLTNKLASLDKDNVRFSVDAGVIDRLGKELVARHETAVSELIKNSYDADATVATLNFANVDSIGGTLTVEDNGNGMSRNQLVNGFMRISSSDKIHEPVSPVYKRKRAGKKGIGRFSAQRLGDKLTIVTQTSNYKNALKVVVDWNKYAMDEELFLIQNKIIEIPKNKDIVSGTTLIIENLRDWWSEAMIKRVYRYALDVIQPFPISKKKIIDNKIADSGFKIICKKNNNVIANEKSMFFEHALAEIYGYVDDNGHAFWEINNSKLDDVETKKPQIIFDDNDNHAQKYVYLKGIQLKAFYFVFNVNLIPKQIESYIRSATDEQGGIRLYRNGFRVLPYGEKQNDWLGLDESVRKRKVLPVHGNNNFFGFIQIEDKNKNFQELSSREGLFRNEAYDELIDFSYKVLIAAIIRVGRERGVKITTDQKDWDAKYSRNPKEALLDAADDLEKLADDLDEIADSTEDTKDESDNQDDSKNKKKEEENAKQKEKAKKIRDKAKSIRDAVERIEEFNMLRVLAGLGLIIGEFTHEIMQYLSAFKIDSKFLIDNLKKSTEEYKRAVRLKETFSSFEVYTSYFDETISQNVNRELKPIELRDVIKPFVKSVGPDLKRNNITLETDYKGYDLFTCKMHVSEWSSILFNLYSNAKKAIKRSNKVGKIFIKAYKDEEKVYLEFQDNGDGIPAENRDKIFTAFFTTSSPKGHKTNMKNELSGTGLGLKILSDILGSYNGDISLGNEIDDYSTNFIIELPVATDEEINEYGL